MSKKSASSDERLIEALKEILRLGSATTQQEICEHLSSQGFDINQTKVSRLLNKLSAIKIKDSQGQIAYHFPKEFAPPPSKASLNQLILKISANEHLIVIQTSPGSASLIARMLDYQSSKSEILATLAGDDTIFVAPKSVKRIAKTLEEINYLLSGINIEQ